MTFSEEELLELHAITDSSYDGSVRARAQIVLWRKDHSVAEVAKMAGVSRPTVRKWVARYAAEGMDGLSDRPHPGGEKQVPPRARGRILALTRKGPPESSGLSHWSSRTMADWLRGEGIEVSHSFVATLWKENGLQPHRTGTHKLPRDPLFEAKVRSVVGLYLNPPDNAVVLSVDEKTQVQALDRTQPLLPVSFGHAEQRTADYVRHGTTNLFAALDTATGQVVGQCRPTRKTEDFLAFMDQVVARYPDKEMRVVLDNLSTHSGEKIDRWVGEHPRVKFCYTPVDCSWLNQVETWFNIITKQSIRRGSFVSVPHLVKTIKSYIDHWNTHPHPFRWTAEAEDIIDRVAELERELGTLIDNAGRKSVSITRH